MKELFNYISVTTEHLDSRAKYGVSKPDTWNLNTYLSQVIANSLELYIDNAHGWPCSDEFPEFDNWVNEVRKNIIKLRNFAHLDDAVGNLGDELDLSNEPEPFVFGEQTVNGVKLVRNPEPTPIFDEYCRRSTEIELSVTQQAKEAIEWVARHWNSLWD